MKVLVVGASGGTGLHAVNKLLARGDDVVAYARNPDSFPVKHAKLTVAKGDAKDAAALEAAVAGVDAVFSALGPRSLKKDDLQEVFMKNLVAAMKKHGVKRVVSLGAWGAGDSIAYTPFVFKIALSTLLRNVFADKNRGEAHLLGSDLEFVNVRPGQLIDKPKRGGVKASLTNQVDGKALVGQMTREDLADFMIEQLTGGEWVRKSPIIGY